MRPTLAIVVAALVIAVSNWTINPHRPQWRDLYSISAQEAVTLGQTALWVDARHADRYRAGHFPHAINATESHWDDGLGKVLDAITPSTTAIIVYCDSAGCRSSHHLAKRLQSDLGRNWDIRVVTGGWPAVSAASKP